MNPKTGRKTERPGAPDDLTVVHAPHLRIIDDKLWEAVDRVCRDRGISKFDSGGRRLVMPRKDWLLAGMLCCGARSGDMIVVNSERVASATARARGPTSKTCSLLKSYGNQWLAIRRLPPCSTSSTGARPWSISIGPRRCAAPASCPTLPPGVLLQLYGPPS